MRFPITLQRAGIDRNLADTIFTHLKKELYDGIPTQKIYKLSVNFLLTLKYKMGYYLNSRSNTMNKYKQIKRELKNKKELVACAKQLSVVGDTTRLKICYLLCHYTEFSVGEMANILDTSISVVSHSVKKLLNLQLVQRRKETQTVYYSLTTNDFTKTLKNFIP